MPLSHTMQRSKVIVDRTLSVRLSIGTYIAIIIICYTLLTFLPNSKMALKRAQPIVTLWPLAKTNICIIYLFIILRSLVHRPQGVILVIST